MTTLSIQTTYTKARANFAQLCNQVTEDREIVIIQRRNAEDVALISVNELSSLLETAHLFNSPSNAERLLTALARAKERTLEAESPQALREEFMLQEEADGSGEI